MSARLTLLVLCDPSELHSQMFSAFLSADFEIVSASHSEQARQVLSVRAVDAILIRHDSLPDGSSAGTQMKRIAPRTPVFLLADERVRGGSGPHPGLDSVCYADFRHEDESVMWAIAVFFRNALTRSRAPQANVPSETVGFRRSNFPTQVAV